MAVYAIGDIQGCYDELQALLARIDFTPDRDRLWFAGDLVNRGPKSLETLRFIRGLGDGAVSVLGNHDLHLLAAAHGYPLNHDDHTLDAILTAPDRDALIDWLQRQPLLHHDAQLGFTMVHAGLPPQWNLALASACAREVETVLQGDRFKAFIEHMYGNKPKRWSESLDGWGRLRFIVNCLTRMRFCDADGKLESNARARPANNGKVTTRGSRSRGGPARTCTSSSATGPHLEHAMIRVSTRSIPPACGVASLLPCASAPGDHSALTSIARGSRHQASSPRASLR